jgi:hypothetical protein
MPIPAADLGDEWGYRGRGNPHGAKLAQNRGRMKLVASVSLIRVIERSNAKSMDLTRLLPDGSVLRGAAHHGHTSTPTQCQDGTVLFSRTRTLIAARDLAIEDQLELCPGTAQALSTPVAVQGKSAYFALSDWPSDPIKRKRLVRVDRVVGSAVPRGTFVR